MIEVEGLTKSFGEIRALADVSFSVRPGEIVGLLGPNGAGKTTAVRVLATLLRPDAGHVRIGGIDAIRDPHRARQLLGLAGQAAAVDELLTGRENLELIGGLYGLGHTERRRRAAEVLERFDLVDAADRRAGTYSGGMRRRLDLGTTLVGRPKVMLLDEPTAGLDPRSRSQLWDLVERVAGDGTSVLLTSQHLEEAERLAGRIVVIDRGLVIADGAPETLKSAVAADVLQASLVNASAIPTVERLLFDLGDGHPVVNRDEQRVSVATRQGVTALVTAARRLDDAGVELVDLGLRRPSLDDVFFALTGRAAPAAEPLGAAPAVRAQTDRRRERVVERRTAPSHTLRDLVLVAGRSLRRMSRMPQVVILAVAQPVVFLVMLRAVFGGLVVDAIGGRYIQYLLPGVVVMNVILGTGVTAAGMAEDLRDGVIDRFRSLPMSRAAVVVGRTVADLARNAVALVALFGAGVAMGFRPHGGLVPAVGGAGLVLLFAFSISWLFAFLGMAVKRAEAAPLLSLLVALPLVYLSGAWIPVDSMSGGLRAFARNQPVNAVISAVRALNDGTPAAHHVWTAVVWSLGILALSVPLCVRRYRGDGY